MVDAEYRPNIGDEIEVGAWRIKHLVLVMRAKLVLMSPMITDPNRPVAVKCHLGIVEFGGDDGGSRVDIICDWIDGKLYYDTQTVVAGALHAAGDIFDAINVDEVTEALVESAAEWTEKNG